MAHVGCRTVARSIPVIRPSHEARAPGEAAAEGREHEQVAAPELRFPLGKAERDRRGGGVAVPLDVDHHLLHRDADALGGGGDDAQVGLVRHEKAEVLARQLVALQDLGAHVGHAHDGLFEDALAVLVQVVHPRVERGVGGGVEAAPPGHAEQVGARAVHVLDAVEQAEAVGVGFEEHRARPVAEEDGRVAVLVVDDARHLVGADDEHAVVLAARDKLRARVEREQKARARRRQVEAPRVRGAEVALNEAGRGGKEHVRRHRRHDDQVHGVRGEAALLQAAPGGFGPHEGGGPGGVIQDAALGDAGARADPLVVRLHEPFEVGVRQTGFRDIMPHGCDGRASCAHQKRRAQPLGSCGVGEPQGTHRPGARSAPGTRPRPRVRAATRPDGRPSPRQSRR